LNGVFVYYSKGPLYGNWLCSGSTQANCTGGTSIYGNLANRRGSQVGSTIDTILGTGINVGYDEFNRVTSANYTVPGNSFTYTYDRYGNRWSQNLTHGSGPSPQFGFNPATNQISGYTYDAAGNLTYDGVHHYTYDAEGNLLQVDGGSTATYAYDAFNHREQSVVGGTNTQFVIGLNGQRQSSWNGSSSTPTLLSAITYWNGRPVSYYNGSTHFQHQDVLGTERLRTASDGTVEGSYQSLAFGDGFSALGTDNDPSHFAQLDHDAESYTEHAQFRQYSSTQGRWMSPDPYNGSYDPSNPQSFNRYAYGANNPLSNTDPTGLYVIDCTWQFCSPCPYCGGAGGGSGGGGSLSYTADTPPQGASIVAPNQQLQDEMVQAEARYEAQVNLAFALANAAHEGGVGEVIDVNCNDDLFNLDCAIASWSARYVYNPADHYLTGDARIRAMAQAINGQAGVMGTFKGVGAFYGVSLVGAAGGVVAADAAAGAEGSILFGRGYYGWTGYLNGNAPWGAALRVGFGWNGAQQVFRISGNLIDSVKKSGHIDWPW